jgi:hypothetical protein
MVLLPKEPSAQEGRKLIGVMKANVMLFFPIAAL